MEVIKSSPHPSNCEVVRPVQEFRSAVKDPNTVSQAARRIINHLTRMTAPAIHMTKECSQGRKNALSDTRKGLAPDAQLKLIQALIAELVSLREKAW